MPSLSLSRSLSLLLSLSSPPFPLLSSLVCLLFFSRLSKPGAGLHAEEGAVPWSVRGSRSRTVAGPHGARGAMHGVR